MKHLDDEHIKNIFKAMYANISSLEKGRNHLEKRAYKKALVCYLNGLDGSVGLEENLRLEESLAELVAKHAPAREALEQRRNEMETWIQNGRISRKLHEEWNAINQAIGDTTREVELLTKLKTAADGDDFNIYQVIEMSLPKLLLNRNYALIEPHLNQLGSMFLGAVTNYECEVFFPRRAERSSEIADMLKTRVLESGPLIYEACLGLERLKTAREIARMVLAICSNHETYRAFLSAAKNAGSESEMSTLIKEAEKRLSETEHSALKQEFKH